MRTSVLSIHSVGLPIIYPELFVQPRRRALTKKTVDIDPLEPDERYLLP